MSKFILFMAVAALAAGSAAGAATDTATAKGEAKLAKLLDGRVAGAPVSCISATIGDHLQVIDQTAVVYDGGSTVYVARPADPKSLDADDVLIIDRFGSQLCKQDVIRTVDRNSGFMTGVVFLGDFVPYKKP